MALGMGCGIRLLVNSMRRGGALRCGVANIVTYAQYIKAVAQPSCSGGFPVYVKNNIRDGYQLHLYRIEQRAAQHVVSS